MFLGYGHKFIKGGYVEYHARLLCFRSRFGGAGDEP
jgi:hypothetical protein